MLMTWVSYIFCFGFTVIFILACLDIIKKIFTDSKLHLAGPTPLPFIGNLLSIVKKGIRDFDASIVEKYGKVARYYEGTQLNIMVTDKDEIKRILISDADHFRNRQVLSAVNMFPLSCGLPSLKDDEWGRVRTICNHFFTDASLSKLLPQLKPLRRELAEKLLLKSAVEGGHVNIESMLFEYAAQTIATLIFGTHELNESDIQKFMKTMDCFRNPSNKELKFAALTICPYANIIMDALNCSLVDKSNLTFLIEQIKETINHANSDSKHYNFVTFANDAKDANGQGLSFNHILGQAITFYLAGQHTISMVLSFAIYQLALDQDLQKRAAAEAAETPTDTIASIGNAKLLKGILFEAMRMYPPSIRIDRVAEPNASLHACPYIPANTTMVIPLTVLHSNVENPEKYDPDRSSLEDRPGNFEFLPFGKGPRFCIGKRFAMMVMTSTLVSLLKTISFQRCSLTEVPLKLKKKTCNRTENGIWLSVMPRQQG